MRPHSARLVAAGLWTFGAIALIMVARNLDAAGLILLVMGLACVVTANWINRVTASSTGASVPPAEAASGSSTPETPPS
jgi:hypothetical protein